jgi:hypothetical protein
VVPDHVVDLLRARIVRQTGADRIPRVRVHPGFVIGVGGLEQVVEIGGYSA